MNDLDVDVTGRIDGNWKGQQVRITGGNGSPLEYAYTLVYLLGLSGSVGLGVAVLVGAITLYVMQWEWGWVLLTMLAVTAVVTAVSHLLLVASLTMLMKAYGGNHQPRNDDGRYIPLYQNGGLTGHIFAKNRRNTSKIRGMLRGGGVDGNKKAPKP